MILRQAITVLLLLSAATATTGEILTWLKKELWPKKVYNDIPDPKDTARMARFIVHHSNWTSVSYISHAKETNGFPMSALFSVSDGPTTTGSGVPYFYVSRLQAAVADLLDNDGSLSLMMSLAQSSICSDHDLDPEDPRCAHVVLTGTFERINETDKEYPTAKEAIFTRHPSFARLPANHHFFIAKCNIMRIIIQDRFGGPSEVPVHEYFDLPTVSRKNLFHRGNAASGRTKINILAMNLLIGLTMLYK